MHESADDAAERKVNRSRDGSRNFSAEPFIEP